MRFFLEVTLYKCRITITITITIKYQLLCTIVIDGDCCLQKNRLVLVAQPSVTLLGVTFRFHLPPLLLCSAEHSLSLVQQHGMTCHLSFAFLLVFTRHPFTPY